MVNEPSPGARPLPGHVLDAAIDWCIKVAYNKPTPQTRRAFEHWLQADPLHQEAWQRLTALRGPFGQVPAPLVTDALHRLDSQRRARRLDRRNGLKLLSLGGLSVMVGVVGEPHVPWQRLVADTATRIGEQRALDLDDGTRLVLNTDTAVSVQLAGAERVITLRRGEIQITTGADAAHRHRTGRTRPFWVVTPVGQMQALGTRFTVRLAAARARVSVQEGAVALHPGGKPHTIVRPGESRWMSETQTLPADLLGLEPDAWADGVIAGHDMRLADLLAELSRYRPGHIGCDERVAGLRVSGLFHVKNTDQVLQLLAQTQPVDIVYRTRYWVTVAPAHRPDPHQKKVRQGEGIDELVRLDR